MLIIQYHAAATTGPPEVRDQLHQCRKLPENLVISFHFQKSTFLDIFPLMQLACPAAFAIGLLRLDTLRVS